MISRQELEALLEGKVPLWSYLDQARKLKEAQFGLFIETCSILNAKSGRCPSDCAFCAQSIHHRAQISVYPLRPKEELISAAQKAFDFGVDRFSFVTSGIHLSPREFDLLLESINEIRTRFPSLKICASLGQIGRKELELLKEVGLSRYHHNLETAPDFYPRICSRQAWKHRWQTAERVKEVGLSLCCGGIFGLGEGPQEILKLAELLISLGPDSIPINFLHPIAGTPLEGSHYLTPLKCLAILCVFRFLLPEAEIRVCGGREYNLRDLQALALLPANALMVGHYLTTRGRELAHDQQMIEDLGYQTHLKTRS